MILSINGIKLIRLSEGHLEQVREWRNSDGVRFCMEYQDLISMDQQLGWFTSINNLSNFYFVINYKQSNGGLINISRIDYKNNTAQAGLFLAEGKFRNTPVPVLASLCVLKFGFYVLSLDEIFAKVGVKNITAYNYNTALGFYFFKHESEGFDLLKIDKDSFGENHGKFEKLVGQSSKNKFHLTLDKHDDQDSNILELMDQRRSIIESGYEIIMA